MRAASSVRAISCLSSRSATQRLRCAACSLLRQVMQHNKFRLFLSGSALIRQVNVEMSVSLGGTMRIAR